MGRDLGRATFIHHIREVTGKYNDDPVAVLIAAAESLDETEQPAAYRAETKPAAYTAEAHVKWRNRDSCKGLLAGPSEDVKRLLEAMESDLKN